MITNPRKEMWITALAFLLAIVAFSILIQNSFK